MDIYNASLGENQPEEIELSLEQYEEAKKHYTSIIERGEAARRLTENPDFKMLIMEGYLTSEPMRLAELMASGRLNSTTMENCKNEISAIGSFRNFMKLHIEQGNLAKESLVDLEEARDEAIAAEARAIEAKNQ